MKKVLKKIIVLCLCLFMCTGCDLKDIIKDLLANTSSSSQQIGGASNEGCLIYSTLNDLYEDEGVSLLSSRSEFEEVLQQVDESTFMATACYVVAGVRYERIASGFIIKKEILEDAYKYYLVSNASKLFFRGVNDNKQTVLDRTPEYIEVVFGDYRRYYAEVFAYYERFDIVILTITTKDELTPLSLGDSDNLMIGDDIYAMGTPEIGVSVLNTTLKGRISKLNVNLSLYFNDEQITSCVTHQFDSPTNYGMEGGPVFTENGEVVGILTYKYRATDQYESLARFIPINNIKNCLESLLNNKEYEIAKLGVQVMDLYVAVSLDIVTWTDGLGVYEGCYIESVVLGSAAANAGITGDSVAIGAYLNDEYYEIKNSDYVSIILSRYKQGDTLKLVIQYKDGIKEHVVFNG